MQKYVGAVIDVCGSGGDTNLAKIAYAPTPWGTMKCLKPHYPPPMPHVSPGWGGGPMTDAYNHTHSEKW